MSASSTGRVGSGSGSTLRMVERSSGATAGGTGSTLDLGGLPAPVVETIRSAYADSTAVIFLIV